VIEGKLTIEEAQVSPLRTILVNAIGVSADVGVEMAHVTLKKGDRMLLCSDGLHDYFPVEEEIAQRMSTEKPGEALKEMVELAKTRGGHDNITGVAVHITEIHEPNVPKELGGDESTQPVDIGSLGGNPFADETTQKAEASAMALGRAQTPQGGLKQTQPMRVVDNAATGATLPPPVVNPSATAPTVPPPMKGNGVDPDVKTEPKPALAADTKPDDKKDGVPTEEASVADTGQQKKPDAT
jgi:hypothetical protein